jgi:hypothetical protein
MRQQRLEEPTASLGARSKVPAKLVAAEAEIERLRKAYIAGGAFRYHEGKLQRNYIAVEWREATQEEFDRCTEGHD